MRAVAVLILSAGLGTVLGGAAWAAEPRDWQVKPVGKVHTIAAATQLSGPGSSVPGLPMTYDMSLFEWNWGGRQASFNGAGITTNSNFPLVDGEALSANNDLGLEATAPSGLVLGVQAEWYALAGDRTVGRVFGEELPWDNFDRVGGALVPSRSNLDLEQGWLRYAQAPWSVQLTAGSLPPQTLPEFTRKTINHLKLGSLLWRPPITNASFFEKEDRKLEEGRHPVRGADLILDYAYQPDRHLHLEFFSGQTKPTPIAAIDRLSWGGRFGADVGRGNIGTTFVRADGDQPRAERQDLWAVDASYPLLPRLTPYGVVARSSYTRGSQNLDGTAAVGGLAVKGPGSLDAKVQYQRVGENYDLIGTHKVEHYPSNLRGVSGEANALVGPAAMKAVVYHVQQMETNTRTGDTLFGDSYFPAIENSTPGTITVWRWVGELGPWGRVKPKGYIEQAHFRKDALADANDIDKRVTSLVATVGVTVTPHWSFEAGVRHLIATGRWQTLRFHHRQEIPEASVTYRRGDTRATMIYQAYDFEEAIAAGKNNYRGHQLLIEFRQLL